MYERPAELLLRRASVEQRAVLTELNYYPSGRGWMRSVDAAQELNNMQDFITKQKISEATVDTDASEERHSNDAERQSDPSYSHSRSTVSQTSYQPKADGLTATNNHFDWPATASASAPRGSLSRTEATGGRCYFCGCESLVLCAQVYRERCHCSHWR